MATSDDPLYIVPAVVPDDPEAPASAANATTVTTKVVRSSDESKTRAVRFERGNVRRKTRVIRHVDPWSVFRVALAAHMVLYVVLLLAGVLLWNVAKATGTVDNMESFMESFGWETFTFNGGALFHQAWVLGLFAVVGLTGLAVLLATTFNLLTDLVGGIRVTVIEVPGRPPVARPHKKTTTSS